MILTRAATIMLLLLRIATGWLLAYDGYLKFTNTKWSLIETFSNTAVFPQIFNLLSQQPLLGFLNYWYPLLLMASGIMVMLGLWMRFGVWISVSLISLIYLAGLHFPLTLQNGFLVDKYLIYILVLLTVKSVQADHYWGLGANIHINR